MIVKDGYKQDADKYKSQINNKGNKMTQEEKIQDINVDGICKILEVVGKNKLPSDIAIHSLTLFKEL